MNIPHYMYACSTGLQLDADAECRGMCQKLCGSSKISKVNMSVFFFQAF